jgi:Domain of unknown function (DUF4293)
MIQRIQSVYLAAVFLISLLLFKGAVLGFSTASGDVVNLFYSGRVVDSAGKLFAQIGITGLLPFIIALIPLLSLITLLIFRKRKTQRILSDVIIVFSAALIIILSAAIFLMTSRYNTTIIPGYKIGIPVVILILSFLARGGIVRDERLIKSYDRLR